MDKKTLIDKIAELTVKVGDLEQELCDLEDDLSGEEADDDLYADDWDGNDQYILASNPDPDFLETLDPYIFLREIGLDPFNLPSSVGDRREITEAILRLKTLMLIS